MAQVELRCENGQLFGRATSGSGVLEVSCRNRRCGFRSGQTVVLHLFDLASGKVLTTTHFKDPQRLFAGNKTKENNRSGAHSDSSSVRAS